jgi:hypothetical protein
MHYLLWTVLNIGLLLYGLYLLIHIFYLVKEKYGLLKSIFAVLLLFSMCSSPNRDRRENTLVIGENGRFTKKSMQESESGTIALSPMQSILVVVSTEKDSLQHTQHIECESSLKGLMGGLSWKPLSFYPESKHRIRLTGSLRWQVLGITFYTEVKSFSVALKSY